MAVLNPLRGGHRQLPGGAGRGVRGREQPGRSRRRARAACRSRASCTSNATTSARIRRRSSSGWRPAGKCGCAAPTSSPAPAWSRTQRGEVVELRCTLRSGHARRRCAGRPEGEGDAALGVGRARPRRRGPALRPAVQERDRQGRRRIIVADLNPASLEVLPGAKVEPSLAGALPGSRYQFERLGYFAWIRIPLPPARLQPDRHAQGCVGANRAARVASADAPAACSCVMRSLKAWANASVSSWSAPLASSISRS